MQYSPFFCYPPNQTTGTVFIFGITFYDLPRYYNLLQLVWPNVTLHTSLKSMYGQPVIASLYFFADLFNHCFDSSDPESLLADYSFLLFLFFSVPNSIKVNVQSQRDSVNVLQRLFTFCLPSLELNSVQSYSTQHLHLPTSLQWRGNLGVNDYRRKLSCWPVGTKENENQFYCGILFFSQFG